MRSLHSCLGSFVVVGVVAVGCQASGDGEGIKDDTVRDQTPTEGVPLAPPSSGSGSDGGDSGSGGDDGSSGNVADSSTMPGSADGGPPTPCTGVCVPGATQPCGNCGTRTCTTACGWAFKCVEPPNACPAGITEYSTAGCTIAGTYRTRTCDVACAWGPFAAACADANVNKMTISSTVTGVVSAGWTVADGDTGKRPMGCTAGASVSPDATFNRVRVEVSNPTAQTAKVSLYQSKAQGFSDMDMVMWVYSGTLPPMTDADLVSCAYGVADDCIAGNPCNNPNTLVFAGMTNVLIPPNGKILVYNSGYASVIQGPFTLNVRTDGFQ